MKIKKNKISRHHRKPSSVGGMTSKDNISYVSEVQHNAWHVLFENHTPHFIVMQINTLWLDPDYEFILHKKGDH